MMPRTPQTRLPLRPLLGAARAESVSDLARRIGVPIRRAQDWSTNGIPLYRADDLAARRGCTVPQLLTDLLIEETDRQTGIDDGVVR